MLFSVDGQGSILSTLKQTHKQQPQKQMGLWEVMNHESANLINGFIHGWIPSWMGSLGAGPS